MNPTTRDELDRIEDLLTRWVRSVASEEAFSWLEEQRTAIAEGAEDWVFFTSFSGVPRYTGKAPLELGAEDVEAAEAARSDWDPTDWSVDQAGRTLMVLAAPHEDPDPFARRLDRVWETADVGESVVLAEMLPVLPHGERHVDRAREGLRSNMTSVFEGVALENPFPRDYFEENAWNQMVLKAIFGGSPLHRIVGLDERANAQLARMLVDYAHERWSASRSVTPELWRPVGPYAEGEMIDDLARVLETGEEAERKAAALALDASPDSASREALAEVPELAERVASGSLTWASLVEEHLATGAQAA